MTNEEIKTLIAHSIAVFKAGGGTIARGIFGAIRSDYKGGYVNDSKRTCAIGALVNVVKDNPSKSPYQASFLQAVASSLDKPEQWIWDFIGGFDGNSLRDLRIHKDAYDMGVEVAKEFLPKVMP